MTAATHAGESNAKTAPWLKTPAALRALKTPTRSLRRASWRAHAALLPLLHCTDRTNPSNSCVNLQVLWLKALAGARGATSDHLSYRLLPKESRWVISRPLCWMYPPWHDETIARRTRFIDGHLKEIIESVDSERECIHVVTLGAGFDSRPLRTGVVENLGTMSAICDERLASWAEIDLPDVVDQKAKMLSKLTRRRPWLARQLPAAYRADLATARGRAVVRRAAAAGASSSSSAGSAFASVSPSSLSVKRVFIVEALLMYLPDAAALQLLRTCGRVPGATVVFADRLPGHLSPLTSHLLTS